MTVDEARAREGWSHPTGVRGLKLHQSVEQCRRRASHPTGVRGLKLVGPVASAVGEGRTPLGCVD